MPPKKPAVSAAKSIVGKASQHKPPMIYDVDKVIAALEKIMAVVDEPPSDSRSLEIKLGSDAISSACEGAYLGPQTAAFCNFQDVVRTKSVYIIEHIQSILDGEDTPDVRYALYEKQAQLRNYIQKSWYQMFGPIAEDWVYETEAYVATKL